MEEMPKKPLILVVDGHADIQELLRLILEDQGFDAITASDGKSALELFKTHQPHAVLTAEHLADMTALDLLASVRGAQSPHSVCPVVVLAERSDSYDEFHAAIARPQGFRHLVATLKQILA